ncbi:6715_t:CDS:2, partial [Entrophospora sp. SA101]
MNDWVFTDENHPFENQRISALDAKNFSTEEVRSLLSINEKNESFISNERISLTIDKESEKAENGGNKEMVNIVLAIEEAGNNTVAKLIRAQHRLKKIKLIAVQTNFKSDLLKEAVINHQDTIVDYDVDGFGSLIQAVPSFKNLRSLDIGNSFQC